MTGDSYDWTPERIAKALAAQPHESQPSAPTSFMGAPVVTIDPTPSYLPEEEQCPTTR